mgnify:CR=1 FL=1
MPVMTPLIDSVCCSNNIGHIPAWTKQRASYGVQQNRRRSPKEADDLSTPGWGWGGGLLNVLLLLLLLLRLRSLREALAHRTTTC